MSIGFFYIDNYWQTKVIIIIKYVYSFFFSFFLATVVRGSLLGYLLEFFVSTQVKSTILEEWWGADQIYRNPEKPELG